VTNEREIVVDNFACGGGASTGIEAALGRPVDIAINHNAKALAVHLANHPHTLHLREDIRDLDPRQVGAGRSVGLGWFSPDCTYHSKARGGKPFRERNRARRVRGLAWTVIRWAKERRPRVIMLENVEEFADWGPLGDDGRPDPTRRGMTFRRWHRQLENLGYQVDMRELRACDYGAPTSRKRLFVIARCDGDEIVFPAASHGPWIGAQPYRTAAECIDWSIPCPSIFTRERPLAEATLRRIARGVMRYVVQNPKPFIVPAPGAERAPFLTEHANASTQRNFRADEPLRTICAQVKGGHFALVAAFLARHYGGHENDGHPVSRPISTITTQDHHHLVASHVVKLRGDNIGQPADQPLQTVSAQGSHFGEVRAFLLKYYGTDQDPRIERPLGTITTKDRFGLVTVHGEPYAIVDIGMRMLTPRELARATSFPDDYILDPIYEGKPLSKTDQVWMIGNAVPPAVAEALVRANVTDQARQAAA
jgi:DNA (cytosine-5)-methyltransferase 1